MSLSQRIGRRGPEIVICMAGALMVSIAAVSLYVTGGSRAQETATEVARLNRAAEYTRAARDIQDELARNGQKIDKPTYRRLEVARDELLACSESLILSGSDESESCRLLNPKNRGEP